MVQDWEQPAPGSFLPADASSRATPAPDGSESFAETVPVLLRSTSRRSNEPGLAQVGQLGAVQTVAETERERQEAIVDALITSLARVLAHAVRDRIPLFIQDVMATRLQDALASPAVAKAPVPRPSAPDPSPGDPKPPQGLPVSA